MNQSAVEWLCEQLKINNYISDNAYWVIYEAIEMEKKQIQDAKNLAFQEALKEFHKTD